jgi:DNA polymerase-1
VYGISDYGLSQNINTTVQTANEYIKKYFERYPKVKQYMDDNVAKAKKDGYVKTMYGRIRNMPDINSSNYNIRQFNERAAMNMPLQGSASDIIKLAMIKVYNELTNQNLRSKLILQVHDELIVDTHPDEIDVVSNILENCMQNVAELRVPLIVNVAQGDSWKDAK